MPSRRQLILEVLRDRVAVITKAAGFDTDAGRTVFVGEAPELGDDDPDEAIALIVGDESPTYQGENLYTEFPINIAALVKADIDQPYLAAEAVLGDIKRAVELEDRSLGGLVKLRLQRGPTRTMRREPGSATVGIAIEYRAPHVEAWGNP
jgi:hypothetical protein